MTNENDVFDLREFRLLDGMKGGLPPEKFLIHDQDIVVALEEDKGL